MIRCICNICDKSCKELSPFCSKRCEEKHSQKYARLIEWDKANPNPTWEQCDERQRIVAECKKK